MLTGFAAGIMLAIATFGLVDKSISFLSGSSPPFIIAIIIVFQIRSKMLILLFLNKILINLHSLDNSWDWSENYVEVISLPDCRRLEKDKRFECPYF